jgi:hypothetical protein
MTCQYCGEFAVRDDICYDCWLRVGTTLPEEARSILDTELSKILVLIENGPEEWRHRIEARLRYLRGGQATPEPAFKLTGKIKVRGLK